MAQMDNNSYPNHYGGGGRPRLSSQRGNIESREQDFPWRTGEREPYPPFEGPRRRVEPALRRGPPERSYRQRDYYRDIPPSPNHGMDAPMLSMSAHGSAHGSSYSRRDFSRRSGYSGLSESALVRPHVSRGESLPEVSRMPPPRMGIDMPRSESSLYANSLSSLPPSLPTFVVNDGGQDDGDISVTAGQDQLWLAAQDLNFRESLEQALMHSLNDDPEIEAQIEAEQMREALRKSQETEAEDRDLQRVADLENVELALRRSIEDKEHAEELEAMEESMRMHALRLSMTETEARNLFGTWAGGAGTWKDKKVRARPTVATIAKLENHIRPRAQYPEDLDDDWIDSKPKSSDRVIGFPVSSMGEDDAEEKREVDQELVSCLEDSKVLPHAISSASAEKERVWFNGNVVNEEKIEEDAHDPDEELRMALEASLNDIHQGGSFDAYLNTDTEDRKEKPRAKSDSEVEGSTVASTLTMASIVDDPHGRFASLPKDAVLGRDTEVTHEHDIDFENPEKETEEAIGDKTSRQDSSEHEELDLALAIQLSEQDAELALGETAALPAENHIGVNSGTPAPVISTDTSATPPMGDIDYDSRRDLLLRPCFRHHSMTDVTSDARRRSRHYTHINDHRRYSDGMARDFALRPTYDERRQPVNHAHISRRQYELDQEQDRRGMTRRTQSERHMQETLYQGLMRTARALERGEASVIVCRGCAKTLSFPSCESMVWCPSCATLTLATNFNAPLNT